MDTSQRVPSDDPSVPSRVAWKLMGKEALLQEIKSTSETYNSMVGTLYKEILRRELNELRQLYTDAGGSPLDWPIIWS